MTIDVQKLMQNNLFNNLTQDDIASCITFDSCTLSVYKKNTLIAQANEPCDSVGFILEGAISVQQLDPTGEVLTIKMFHSNDCFAAPLLYLNNPVYPFSLFTTLSSTVIYIPFEQLLKLIQSNSVFNTNYMTLLAYRMLTLKDKVQILNHKDVRSRLILYFSTEMKRAGSPSFNLFHKKTEIADLIGVARPSLSRELSLMERDQLIKIEGRIITLLELELFKL